MLPKEIIAQIRKIEIRSGKLVNEMFAGQYSSVFKGRGMEFAEVREYLPGDDIRSIDWNVTARYGHPYVKKFTEEREMTVLFLVDMSGSQRFGTRGNFKAELAAELTSVLAFSAIKNNDRVGMVMFTDKIEKVIRPKKGRNHILRMIRETLYFTPTGTGTNITRALQYLNELWRRKSVVFLISDFNDAGFDQALKVTARRHDLIAVTIADDREKNLPDIGLVELEDAESGQKMTVDTSSAPFIKEYTRRTEENAQRLKTLFTRAHVDSIAVTTGKPYIVPLIQFFRTREKRQATGR
ncbi:MAG: DUF58 domain-containing protein [Elusimicrobia bacterium]|nr:DUF58 domain-containing protein [Elusimicrobiota bacterium]